MSRNERENLSDAFKAVFQTSGLNLEKTAAFDFNADDALINKQAGMPIYNPTQENIENLVLSLIDSKDFAVDGEDNSLADGKWVEIKIQNYAGPHTDVISDATGVVHVPVMPSLPTVDVPFTIKNTEILPFDAIFVRGECVPYSRENLKKISLAMAAKSRELKNGTLQGEVAKLNPYVKLEEKANPTTSVGFLGNTLHIQDKYRFPLMGDDNGMFVTASHAVDDAIEKLATMTPFDWTAIKNSMMKTAAQEKSKEIDDIFELAKTATDTNIADTLLAIDKMQWQNAAHLPNATYIVFPALKDGTELCMQRGIVLSDFVATNVNEPIRRDSDYTKGGVYVLSEDGKIRFIKKEDKFLCIKAAEPNKNFKTKEVGSIRKGDGVVLFQGNKALPPMRCERFSIFFNNSSENTAQTKLVSREVSSYDARSAKVSNGADPAVIRLNFSPICPYYTSYRALIYNRKGNETFKTSYSYSPIFVNVLNGVGKLAPITADEYKQLLRRNAGESKDIQNFQGGYSSDNCPDCGRNYAISPETKVLVFDGILDNFFRDKAELKFVLNNHEITKDDELVFLKTAMENNTVTIECRDKKADKYDVTISFMDRTKTLFSARTKSFKNIPSFKVRGILGAIGFSHDRIGELMYKLRQDNHVSCPLPRNFDSDRITGAKSKSRTLAKFNSLRRKVFDDQKLYSVAEDVVAQALTDTPIAKNSKVRSVVTGIQKRAEEAKILARHFEKLAMDESSLLYKETAKTMLLSSEMFEKTAQMLSGSERYPQIMGISEIVKDNETHFGKLAASLISDKLTKTASEGSVIAPWYYTSAINQMSDMFSLSCSYLEKMAEAPESTEEDLMSEAEKINTQEQLNAMAESKKEDTPGGKYTPTKFVQRKNQHRMNS